MIINKDIVLDARKEDIKEVTNIQHVKVIDLSNAFAKYSVSKAVIFESNYWRRCRECQVSYDVVRKTDR